MTFSGSYRGHAHPHESSPAVTIPLISLAVPSIFIGLIGSPLIKGGDKFSSFIYYGEQHLHHEWGLNVFLHELLTIQGLVPFFAFLLGTLIAWLVYVQKVPLNEFIKNNLNFIYKLSFNKWFIDEVYFWILNKVIMPVYNAGWKFIDKMILDGFFVNGSALMVSLAGGRLKYIETGKGQLYALVIFGSVLVAVLLFVLMMG